MGSTPETGTSTQFDLPDVFDTVAGVHPDRTALVWGERRLTFAEIADRSRRLAAYLRSRGLGDVTERDGLAGHESGQDHLGIYAYNGNEYIEAMLGAFRARVAPFNVNYRYVADELLYLLDNADCRALVYHGAFAPTLAAILDRLPRLEVLLQIEDGSGNALLPGAVDYEAALALSPPVVEARPTPDDLYILYTGGTTGMPKGVLWRQHDIYRSAMGGRNILTQETFDDYEAVAAGSPGVLRAAAVHGAAAAHARRRPVGVVHRPERRAHAGVPPGRDPARPGRDVADDRARALHHADGRRGRDRPPAGRGAGGQRLRHQLADQRRQRRRAAHAHDQGPAAGPAAQHLPHRLGGVVGDRGADEPPVQRWGRRVDRAVHPGAGHSRGERRPRPGGGPRPRGDRLAGPGGLGAARLLQGRGEDGPDVPGDRRRPLLGARRSGPATWPTARSSCWAAIR